MNHNTFISKIKQTLKLNLHKWLHIGSNNTNLMHTKKLSEFVKLRGRYWTCNKQFYKTSVQCSEAILKQPKNPALKPKTENTVILEL